MLPGVSRLLLELEGSVSIALVPRTIYHPPLQQSYFFLLGFLICEDLVCFGKTKYLTSNIIWLFVYILFPEDIDRDYSQLPRSEHVVKSVALSRYEKMCVLHVRKKLSHLQLGSQSDEYG